MADSVFNNLLGSQLVKGDDTVETTKRVGGEGKVLGLYFSAHWCPPCRGFTPKLAEFYNNFRASNGDKLEIVFVSSDRSEKDFKDYFKEMPWLALSFAERERKDNLSRKFKVQGIPTLIFLDGKDGSLISKDGRQCIVEDPKGEEFPWRPKALNDIVKGVLINNKKEETNWDDLSSKVVAFYFSAHWCPPCKVFTPELVKSYNKIVGDSKPLEIIFISSDRSQDFFDEYFGSMPWLAVPYEDKRVKDLSKYFGVEGIPSLIFVDLERKIITANGRSLVNTDPEGKDFPWEPKPLLELNDYTASVVNEEACVIYFTDGEEANVTHTKEVLTPLAEKYRKDPSEGGADPPLYFLYSASNAISERLRDFACIPDEDNVLVILDVPSGVVYISDDDDLTSEGANKFIADYISGKLKGKSLRSR